VNLRHRQRGQTLVLAVVGMTTMLGALSMVVDAGVYFVLQRQLQSSADAAALAAVWYSPACNSTWSSPGAPAVPPTMPAVPPTACQTAGPPNTPANGCPAPPDGNAAPCTAATNQVTLNQSVAVSLCTGPRTPGSVVTPTMDVHPGPALNVPSVTTYVVTLSCDSPHWFARVFPSVCTLPACSVHVSASAAAALGWQGPNGELLGAPPAPPGRLVARLIL
jgi:putative Flp pilus-assembly TadE/G-like protein